MSSYLVWILGFALAATGCGRVKAASRPEALVSIEQYHQAAEIVRTVDYLPYGARRDGCYARALFISMELAAERIPSSATFAIAPAGTLLYLADGTPWTYHVAPMLQVTGYAPMVIDPALSATPMRQQDWLAAMHGQGAFVYSLPGSDYGYWYGTQVLGSQIVASFDQMPAFRVEDIQHACQTAYKFWGEAAGISEAERASHRQKLASKAIELGQKMQALGKLTNASGLTRYDCQVAPAW